MESAFPEEHVKPKHRNNIYSGCFPTPCHSRGLLISWALVSMFWYLFQCPLIKTLFFRCQSCPSSIPSDHLSHRYSLEPCHTLGCCLGPWNSQWLKERPQLIKVFVLFCFFVCYQGTKPRGKAHSWSLW